MSRVLYFDCFSGISGDMILGAFLDAGLPLDGPERRAGQPGAGRIRGLGRTGLRAGVSATKFSVNEHERPHGHCTITITLTRTIIRLVSRPVMITIRRTNTAKGTATRTATRTARTAIRIAALPRSSR